MPPEACTAAAGPVHVKSRETTVHATAVPSCLYPCHSTVNSNDGCCCALLQGIADSPQLQLPLRKPRKKISVMIVGNHSAGKSSFINWYIGESIQKTVCSSCSSSNGCRNRSRKQPPCSLSQLAHYV